MAKREEFRNVRRSSFTMISNEVINNPELTLQEKGLLAVFLSNSADWNTNMKEIIKRSANGRDAQYKLVNKLIEHGYFARVEIMDEKTGRFEKMVYVFSDSKEDVVLALSEYKDNKFAVINADKSRKKEVEKTAQNQEKSPVPENQDTEENPLPENQDTENRDTENQYINNTNSTNTNLNNTKDRFNLSIKEEIETLDLPVSIKTVLQKQIDRLIEFKIDMQNIELHYHSVKDTYTLSEYTYVLNALLQKMDQAPNDFENVLNNWLKRNREKQNEVAEKKLAIGSKPVREEIVPEWIPSQQAAAKVQKAPEETNPDFLERKEKLQAKLKEKYKKSSNG